MSQPETLPIRVGNADGSGAMFDRIAKRYDLLNRLISFGLDHRWRSKPEALAATGLAPYADEPGFCRSATIDEVRSHGHVLTPGRYVGAADVEDDGVSFDERFSALRAKLAEQFNSGRALEARIADLMMQVSA